MRGKRVNGPLSAPAPEMTTLPGGYVTWRHLNDELIAATTNQSALTHNNILGLHEKMATFARGVNLPYQIFPLFNPHSSG